MMNLSGKKVLITGAAAGLGRELCLQFLDKGAEVLANDLNPEGLMLLKAEVGSRLHIQAGDVCEERTLQSLSAKVDDVFAGRLDVLVNNAGIVAGGAFLDVSPDQHLKTIDVNLKALIHITHMFLPKLLISPDACLLQMGSVTGLMGLAFGSSYASSKWGVLGFSESLRQELRHLNQRNIHICVVCPSYISTGMFEGARAPRLMPFLNPQKLAKKIIRAVELKKDFVKEPFLVKTVPMIRALLPLKIQDAILDWFGVAKGMSHWRGHDVQRANKNAQSS